MSSTIFTGSAVSVIIPAYNSALTIERAIRSVLDQSAVPAQVIVVDDGSVDDTCRVVEKFGARVKLCQQANAGAAAARNRGADSATGQLLAFLDSDDIWHSRKLERQLRVLSQHENVAICTTASLWLTEEHPYDSSGDVAESPARIVTDFREIFLDPYFVTPSVVMRSSVFRECGGFDETLATGEDIDLWLRASYGRVVARIPDRLVCVRMSATSLSARSRGQIDVENLQVIDRFIARHADFARANRRTVRRARSHVLCRLGSDELTRRRFREARLALWAAVSQDPLNSRALYLLARSFVPMR